MFTYEELRKDLQFYQWLFDHQLFLKAHLSEIAVIFPNEEDLYTFVTAREKEGMQTFNGQRDLMRCQAGKADIQDTSFNVLFEFLNMPGDDWRIEAMCVTSGFAPLHRDQLGRISGLASNKPATMHVSWKHETIDEYEHFKAIMRGDNQLELVTPLELSAEYVNSYGVFSYWRYGDLYLKPRVNLRDQ
jgi:hypothetical protein